MLGHSASSLEHLFLLKGWRANLWADQPRSPDRANGEPCFMMCVLLAVPNQGGLHAHAYRAWRQWLVVRAKDFLDSVYPPLPKIREGDCRDSRGTQWVLKHEEVLRVRI